MFLESVEYFLKEKYGEKIWYLICQWIGIKNYVFVIYEWYLDNLMLEIVFVVVEVFGNEIKMILEDFI